MTVSGGPSAITLLSSCSDVLFPGTKHLRPVPRELGLSPASFGLSVSPCLCLFPGVFLRSTGPSLSVRFPFSITLEGALLPFCEWSQGSDRGRPLCAWSLCGAGLQHRTRHSTVRVGASPRACLSTVRSSLCFPSLGRHTGDTHVVTGPRRDPGPRPLPVRGTEACTSRSLHWPTPPASTADVPCRGACHSHATHSLHAGWCAVGAMPSLRGRVSQVSVTTCGCTWPRPVFTQPVSRQGPGRSSSTRDTRDHGVQSPAPRAAIHGTRRAGSGSLWPRRLPLAWSRGLASAAARPPGRCPETLRLPSRSSKAPLPAPPVVCVLAWRV